MSRFFRDLSQLSAESDHSAEDRSIDRSQVSRRDRDRSGESDLLRLSGESQIHGSISTGEAQQQRDILLHALLEERCLKQAQSDLHEERISERVRLVAESQYQHLSQQLARLGLVSAELNDHGLSNARQQIRDGLDLLLGRTAETPLTNARLRITDSSLELQRLSRNLNNMHLVDRMMQQPRLLTGASDSLQASALGFDTHYPHHDLLIDTRYRRDFEEVAMLGRGGFGVVHHCRHRWDGLSYAIKRIPLSSSRIKNIHERGQAEVDEMLLELKTLARLEHPNVVRYFSGWVELCKFDAVASDSHVSSTMSQVRSMSANTQPSGRQQSAASEAHDFITFDDSVSKSTSVLVGASETHDHNAISGGLRRVATHATVSDDEVETISRSATNDRDLSTLSAYERAAHTCLALHIQMGLYPMTLADILVNDANNESRHCFHIEPAARLLSALVDGVAYLHDQGVIHRDLKPANIFLTSQTSNGSVACSTCCAQRGRSTAYKLRIGDFGLVTAVAQQEMDHATTAVGTALYHPSSPPRRRGLHSLDWFATGLIAFELIYPFSTRMERYHTLTALKAGQYPGDFETRFGVASKQIAELIEHLLRPSDAIDVDGLRKMLGLINSH